MVYYLSPQKPMHLFSRTTNSFNTFADRNGPQILKCGGPLLPIPCCQLWGPWGPEYRAIRVLDDWCGWSTWPYDIGSYVDTLVDTLILVDISVDLGWEWAARLPKPGVCALLGKQFNYNMGTTLMWAWVQILHPQDWRNDRCSQWSNPMGQEDTTSTLSLTFPNQRDHPKLVGGFKHFSFFHILGMSSSQRTFIFFKLVKTSNQQTCGFKNWRSDHPSWWILGVVNVWSVGPIEIRPILPPLEQDILHVLFFNKIFGISTQARWVAVTRFSKRVWWSSNHHKIYYHISYN